VDPGPNGPDGPNGLVPTEKILGTIGTIGTLTDDGATSGETVTTRRTIIGVETSFLSGETVTHLFRVQFLHLQFMASPSLHEHELYSMQAGIGETKNGFGKKLGSNEEGGTSSPFSLPQHNQTTCKVAEWLRL